MVIFHGCVKLPEGISDNIWLVVEPTPLKNDGVSNSWDDYSIPN